jgi:hypothetical protein
MTAWAGLSPAQPPTPTPNPLDAPLEAAETAALEKAAADRVLTEKTIALRSATVTAEAAAEAAKKAVEAKVAAERVGAAEVKALAEKTAADLEAQAKSARAAAEKAAAERTAAEKVVQQKAAALNEANQKLNAARAPADKTAGEASKAFADATAAQEAAANVLNQKTVAANQAASTAAASQTAAARAEADRVAAEKSLAEKTAAAKAAADAAAASKAAADKAALAKTADAQAAATKAAADKTAADKAAADKATAEKVLAERTAAAKAATTKAAADKAAADKTAAEKTAADNDLKARAAAARGAEYRAAAARAVAEGGLTILPESAWDYAKARHLLVRAGFGGTPEEVARLHALGLVGAVNYLVDYQYQPDDDISIRIDPPERPSPTENKLSQQERDRLNQRRDSKRVNDFYRLRQWWMRRLVESPRPLQEKLTLFWHGHFVSDWEKLQWTHLLYNQNQLLRDHAAGNFGALLYGIVHDPAMIVYLDNQVNYKGHPNQNLARELMELFSMGVNQGYTEYDIREGARALTGYTYDHYTGQFRFTHAQHDTDAKTLFGQTGPWTGDDFVNLILQQPHTARFISGKLFEYLAYSDPEPRVVTHLAAVLRANQYELGPMLKNLFMSQEFYSPRAMGTQIKGPVQLLVGLLRDFGVKGADYNALVAWCAEMGQELFQPPNVKGWYGGRDWVNANLIFRRYNYVATLIQSAPQPNNQRGLDLVALLEGKGCTTPAQVIDYLAKSSLASPLNEEQKKALADHLGALPPPAEWAKQKDQLNARLRQVLVLMLTTPGYQMT